MNHVEQNRNFKLDFGSKYSEFRLEDASQSITGFMDYAIRETLLPAGVEPSEYRQRFEVSFPF